MTSRRHMPIHSRSESVLPTSTSRLDGEIIFILVTRRSTISMGKSNSSTMHSGMAPPQGCERGCSRAGRVRRGDCGRTSCAAPHGGVARPATQCWHAAPRHAHATPLGCCTAQGVWGSRKQASATHLAVVHLALDQERLHAALRQRLRRARASRPAANHSHAQGPVQLLAVLNGPRNLQACPATPCHCRLHARQQPGRQHGLLLLLLLGRDGACAAGSQGMGAHGGGGGPAPAGAGAGHGGRRGHVHGGHC